MKTGLNYQVLADDERGCLPSDLSIFTLALGSMSTEPMSRISEDSSNADIRWLLEEVVIAASPSPAGAASVDDDEEMANVASNSEELAGNFIIIKW